LLPLLRSSKNKNVTPSTIIYTRKKKDCKWIAQELRGKGLVAEEYHAGLSLAKRDSIHHDFIHDKIPIVVASVAFGMGINKPDIRKVIHWGSPPSIEEYYQQSGRAGRDGASSNCVLFYLPSEFSTLTYLHSLDNRAAAQNDLTSHVKVYVNSTGCRQKFIREYFGEQAEDCKNCDNCNSSESEMDFTEDATKLLKAIKQTRERFGSGIPISVVKGSTAKNVIEKGFHKTCDIYGKGANMSKSYWDAMFKMLVGCKYIVSNVRDKYTTYSLSPVARKFLSSGEKLLLKPTPELKAKILSKENVPTQVGGRPATPFLDSKAEYLFNALIQLNKQEAESRGIPPYMVFITPVLERMAKMRPTSLESFKAIEGIGEQKALNFHTNFIALIKKFSDQYKLKVDISADEMKAVQKDSTQQPRSRATDDSRMTKSVSEIYTHFQVEKKSINDIIALRARPIKASTIISYLGTALNCGLELDVERVKEEIGNSQFELISDAVKSLGDSLPHRDCVRAIRDSYPQLEWGVISFVRYTIYPDSPQSSQSSPQSSQNPSQRQTQTSSQGLKRFFPPRRTNTTTVNDNNIQCNQNTNSSSKYDGSNHNTTQTTSIKGKGSPQFSSSTQHETSSTLKRKLGKQSSFIKHSGNAIGAGDKENQPLKRRRILPETLSQKEDGMDFEDTTNNSSWKTSAGKDVSSVSSEVASSPDLTRENVISYLQGNGGVTTIQAMAHFPQAAGKDVEKVLEELQADFIVYKSGAKYSLL